MRRKVSIKGDKLDSSELVSVIIPVYNVKPFLVEALNSVINQTYGNLEIVIIDDGSTDGSGEIVDEYAERDNRIRVVHQDNRGLSDARNTGLDLATGDFITFFDPDDAYQPRFINTMIDSVLRERADIAICKYAVYYTCEKMIESNRMKPEPSIEQGVYDRIGAIRALVDGKINHSVWNKLYKRSLWKNIRYPSGHVYEDLDTTFRIIDRCERIVALNQPLYLHRRRPNSITETSSKENICDRMLAHSHFDGFIKARTPDIFTKEQLKKSYQLRLNGMIIDYVRYTRNTEKQTNFTKSLRKQILRAGKKYGISNCGLKIKITYYILFICPWALGIVYKYYYRIRRLNWRFIIPVTNRFI